jgi:hypothetical protein
LQVTGKSNIIDLYISNPIFDKFVGVWYNPL